MAKNYSDEEKRVHLDKYKVSGKSKTGYITYNINLKFYKNFKKSCEKLVKMLH